MPFLIYLRNGTIEYTHLLPNWCWGVLRRFVGYVNMTLHRATLMAVEFNPLLAQNNGHPNMAY